ncbi:MAG: RNA methyltransferase [Gemmatimonadales bacterium]|nr:RNA methyltransferase [Gemmatimonadales bacterium]
MGSSLSTVIRDLGRRRGRERRGLTLAEGVRLVEEAIAADVPIRGAVVSPGLEATPRGAALKTLLEARGVRVEPVSDRELDALAGTEHPQGIVAVIEPRQWVLGDIRAGAGAPVVVLDGVQDPGNVGTILRTTLGLGGAGLIVLPGTAELTNPKVVRGSMGALFRLPAVPVTTAEFMAWAGASGVSLWASDAGAAPVTRRDASSAVPIALIFGNEGAGVSDALLAAAARRVAIALAPGAESLNVAVAAGILLYEVTRGS